MRTFIAVEIDTELRNRIETLRDRLRKAAAHVKWVRNTQTHMTLKFLGEIPDASIEQAAGLMADAASQVEPFEFEIGSAGRFPPYSGRVRVLWVGVNDAGANLEKLHKLLDSGVAVLGVERENRPFSAHITIGRVRKQRGAGELIDAVNKHEDYEAGTQQVKELVLFKSELLPEGPRYTVLARAPLGSGVNRQI